MIWGQPEVHGAKTQKSLAWLGKSFVHVCSCINYTDLKETKTPFVLVFLKVLFHPCQNSFSVRIIAKICFAKLCVQSWKWGLGKKEEFDSDFFF